MVKSKTRKRWKKYKDEQQNERKKRGLKRRNQSTERKIKNIIKKKNLIQDW